MDGTKLHTYRWHGTTCTAHVHTKESENNLELYSMYQTNESKACDKK